MNIKTYIIAVCLVWLVALLTDYIGHHLIFSRVWNKFGAPPPVEPPHSEKASWNIAAAFIYALLFVQAYSLNFIGTGPTVGFQFGFLVGCLISIPPLVHRRAQQEIRWELEWIVPFITIAESGFAGIVAGWIFA